MIDNLVEQLVHADEAGAAHVPVCLLAVDYQRLQIDDNRGEELRGTGREFGVVDVDEVVVELAEVVMVTVPSS
ncbi:hypothetical protein GCM10027613_46410 [Microlunatus endophyticus]